MPTEQILEKQQTEAPRVSEPLIETADAYDVQPRDEGQTQNIFDEYSLEIRNQRGLSQYEKDALRHDAESIFVEDPTRRHINKDTKTPRYPTNIEKRRMEAERMEQKARNDLAELEKNLLEDPEFRQEVIDLSLEQLQALLVEEEEYMLTQIPTELQESFFDLQYEVISSLVEDDAGIESLTEAASKADALKVVTDEQNNKTYPNKAEYMDKLADALTLVGSFLRSAGKTHKYEKGIFTNDSKLDKENVELGMDFIVRGKALKECVKVAKKRELKAEDEARSAQIEGLSYPKNEERIISKDEILADVERSKFATALKDKLVDTGDYIASEMIQYNIERQRALLAQEDAPKPVREIPADIYEDALNLYQEITAKNKDLVKKDEVNFHFDDLEILYKYLKSENPKVRELFKGLIVARAIEKNSGDRVLAVNGETHKKDRFPDIRAEAALEDLYGLSQKVAEKMIKKGTLEITEEDNTNIETHLRIVTLMLSQTVKENDFEKPENVSEYDPAKYEGEAYVEDTGDNQGAWIKNLLKRKKMTEQQIAYAIETAKKKQEIRDSIRSAVKPEALANRMEFYIAARLEEDAPEEIGEKTIRYGEKTLRQYKQGNEKAKDLELSRLFQNSLTLRFISQNLSETLDPAQAEKIIGNILAAEAIGKKIPEEDLALSYPDYAAANRIKEIDELTQLIATTQVNNLEGETGLIRSRMEKLRAQRDISLQALGSTLAQTISAESNITGQDILIN